MHHEFKWHPIKNLDFSGFYPRVLIKDLYLLTKISVCSQNLQELIWVCSYMCLYLLSTTVSTGNEYTLETAIYFQSLLESLLLHLTFRATSVSASHCLSATMFLSWQVSHLELLLSTVKEALAHSYWQCHAGVVKCVPSASVSSYPRTPWCFPKLYKISNCSALSGFGC